MALKPQNRLKRTDFQVAFSFKKKPPPMRFNHPHWYVLVVANGVGFHRLGLVVSRKVDKRAVVRNRIKRIIKSQFKKSVVFSENHTLAQSAVTKGLDWVVVVRPTFVQSIPFAFKKNEKSHSLSRQSFYKNLNHSFEQVLNNFHKNQNQ